MRSQALYWLKIEEMKEIVLVQGGKMLGTLILVVEFIQNVHFVIYNLVNLLLFINLLSFVIQLTY